ncbi:MAG: sugar phosphate isomerase/epimerase family protein [Coraliomargaritaceae bacterium]
MRDAVSSILFLCLLIVASAPVVASTEPVSVFAKDNKEQESRQMSVICQGVTFNQLTFSKTLDVLNELGINAIEAYRGQILGAGFDVKTDFSSMSQEAKDCMKRIAKEKGIAIRHYGVAQGRNPDEWRELFEFAKEMGIEALISEPEYDELSMVDALAQEYGIRVGLHNHAIPTKYWHPDIVLHHLRDLSDYMGISADTGNWIYSGLNPLECIEKLREFEGRIVEVQLKDLAAAKFVPFGTGDSNIAGILRELKRQNFTGPLTIEYFGKQSTQDKVQEIGESLRYLSRVEYWMYLR